MSTKSLHRSMDGWGLLAIALLAGAGMAARAQEAAPRVRTRTRVGDRLPLTLRGLAPDLTRYARIELELPDENLAAKAVLKVQSQEANGEFRGTLQRDGGGGETAVTGRVSKSDPSGFSLRFTNALGGTREKSFQGALYEADGKLTLAGTCTVLDDGKETGGPFPFSGSASNKMAERISPRIQDTVRDRSVITDRSARLDPSATATPAGKDAFRDRAVLTDRSTRIDPSATATAAGKDTFRDRAKLYVIQNDGIDIIDAQADLKTFLKLVRAAGLENYFRGRKLTIFAPNDAAFARVPAAQFDLLLNPGYKDYLKRLLFTCVVTDHRYFLVPKGKKDAEVIPLAPVTTQYGDPLSVEEAAGSGLQLRLYSKRSWIVRSDLDSKNAVLHVTNVVLMPPPPVRFD